MTQPPNPFGDDPFGAPPTFGAQPPAFGGPPPYSAPPVFGAPPPTGPPIYGAPPPAGHTPPANTFATLSVIFAFLFAPAGAVLGHLGLSQIARTAERGRERALIGLSLSYLVIVAAVVSLVVWAATGSGDRTSAAGGGSLAAPFTAAPVAPLGALRPPRDLRENSFEHKPDKPRWTYTHPGTISLAGGDSHIVVVTAKDGVMAVDAATGRQLWQKPYTPTGFDTDRFWLAGPNDCQIDRADTTVACLIKDATAKKGILFFVDVTTGTQRGATTALDDIGTDNYLQRSGDNFVALLHDSRLRGYRPDGTLVWQADFHSKYGGYTNYADQGILLHYNNAAGDVYDAATGKVLVHLDDGADKSIAFAAGFAVSDRNRQIVFYDFTGKQTAAVPSDGFSLLDDILSGAPHFADSEPSSGVYQPLAYNDKTHELRAFDGASGRVLWTTPVTGQDEYMQISRVFGSGTTCFISHGVKSSKGSDIAIKVQQCDQSSNNPFLTGRQQLGWLGGFDGQRVLMAKDVESTTNHLTVACVDISTGQQVWDTTFESSPIWIGAATYVKAHTFGLNDQTLLQSWF